jgi:hypothetical protein
MTHYDPFVHPATSTTCSTPLLYALKLAQAEMSVRAISETLVSQSVAAQRH